jgi:putative FmdB family regulatory protein
MPIYEYECTRCHFRFERRQHFDEAAVSVCPHCQGKASRVLHSVPIIYKGSGFYTTDYGQRSNPSAEKEKTEEKD